MEAYKQLAEIIKNGGEVTDELKMQCVHSLGYNEEVYKKFKTENKQLEATIAEAKRVLEEEKDDSNKKYDEEDAAKAYQNYQMLVNRNFERTTKSSLWNKLKDLGTEKAKSFMGAKVEEKKKLGAFGSETDFAAYSKKYNQLVEEKGDTFHGITMNSLSVQNFLLEDSDDKYVEAYYNLATKKGYKPKDKYLLSKSDFAISKTKDGYTDINFEALMFKRNELKKWLDANQNLAPKEGEELTVMQKFWDDLRSPKQRRYDRRMERFELINKYLKLYSEANGVDFVTGELFCEMGMTEEEVSKKVKNAAMLLVETQSAIFASFKSEEPDFDELSEAKEIQEEEEEEKTWFSKIKDFVTEGVDEEKELLENYKREEVAALTALYSKIWAGEATGLEYEKTKRTAHTIAQIQAQIGKLEGACKISAGYGKMKNELTGKEFYTGGLQIDAQASVTALSMEMMAEYQTKFLGMKAGAHAKANVDVCKAEAKGCAKFLLVDSEGKMNPSLHVDLAAELALLKMEVNAGVEGLGVGVDANLSFMLGLAARFNVGIKDWKVTLDMAAALGFGAGIKIELDFSELKDMVVEKAMQLGVKAEHFVAGKMASWGIARNSAMVQKFFEEEISKLDATMDEILSIYDDKQEQGNKPNMAMT